MTNNIYIVKPPKDVQGEAVLRALTANGWKAQGYNLAELESVLEIARLEVQAAVPESLTEQVQLQESRCLLADILNFIQNIK